MAVGMDEAGQAVPSAWADPPPLSARRGSRRNGGRSQLRDALDCDLLEGWLSGTALGKNVNRLALWDKEIDTNRSRANALISARERKAEAAPPAKQTDRALTQIFRIVVIALPARVWTRRGLGCGGRAPQDRCITRRCGICGLGRG